LHCDQESVMHLYTAPQLWPQFKPLAAYLGSQLQLLDASGAETQGHGAFDTACYQPWLALHERGDLSPEWGCRAATVELRGQTDVSRELALQDAHALLNWLRSIDAIAEPAPAVHLSLSDPKPLEGVESIFSPGSGVFVPEIAPGLPVRIGQSLGFVHDLQNHRCHTLRSKHGGFVFARTRARAIYQGAELFKIAGAHATRDGALLSL
jgi:uncharacterized protein